MLPTQLTPLPHTAASHQQHPPVSGAGRTQACGYFVSEFSLLKALSKHRGQKVRAVRADFHRGNQTVGPADSAGRWDVDREIKLSCSRESSPRAHQESCFRAPALNFLAECSWCTSLSLDFLCYLMDAITGLPYSPAVEIEITRMQ